MQQEIKAKVLAGEGISREEAFELAGRPLEELGELLDLAREVRRRFYGADIDICSIINARSGLCSEDCRFCAQSSHYKTGARVYPLISPDRALEKARRMEAVGAKRFSLIISGKGIGDRDFEKVLDIFRILKAETSLSFCASLGIIGYKKALRLKDAGVTMYHHNVETGRRYFPSICTTHTFDERVDAIKAVQSAGMEVCAGGIIGMGETMEDRLDMVLEMREIGICYVPVNILNPIPGTPLSGQKRLPAEEILKTVAIFRLIMPRSVIRLCGGREQLKEKQIDALSIAVNGIMIGGYLTIPGNVVERDLEMIDSAGLKPR
jgi:biotin synthase